MAKMTKAQARRRLMEAHKKLTKVYFDRPSGVTVLSLTQIQQIDTIIEKAIKRTK